MKYTNLFVFVVIATWLCAAVGVFAQDVTAQLDRIQSVLNQLQDQTRAFQAPQVESIGNVFEGALRLALSRGDAHIDIEELLDGTFDIWVRRAIVSGIDVEKGVLDVDALGLSASVGISSSTRIVSEGWNPASLSSFSVGDRVNVWGMYVDGVDNTLSDLVARTVRKVR